MPSRKWASGESSGTMFSMFSMLPHIAPASGCLAWGNGLVCGCDCSNPVLAGVMDIAGTFTGAWAMLRGSIVVASIAS
jgi:hypothetical protein